MSAMTARDEFEQALAEYERVLLYGSPARDAALRAALVAMATRGADTYESELRGAIQSMATHGNELSNHAANLDRMLDAALAQPRDAGKQ